MPSAEDAARLPSVRFVSPQIEPDFIDGDGREWDGPSIVHVAVTPRPVQHHQKPFTPVRMGVVRLALEDYEMPDDEGKDKEKKGPPEKSDKSEGGGGGFDLKKVMELLAGKGITLPDSTTDENFMEYLIVALTATGVTESETG